jgi:hypothetical protein
MNFLPVLLHFVQPECDFVPGTWILSLLTKDASVDGMNTTDTRMTIDTRNAINVRKRMLQKSTERAEIKEEKMCGWKERVVYLSLFQKEMILEN